jgi:hypothetical protein
VLVEEKWRRKGKVGIFRFRIDHKTRFFRLKMVLGRERKHDNFRVLECLESEK